MIVTKQIQELEAHYRYAQLELEDYCLQYLSLQNRLRYMEEGEAKDDLKADLHAMYTQLESAAVHCREALDRLTDNLPDDDD